MRLVRYDDNRLGLLKEQHIHDVSSVVDRIPASKWPHPPGDALIAALPELRADIEEMADQAPTIPLGEVTLLSPVASPSKIIAAPVNYMLHLEEARGDAAINYGMPVKTIDELGLFLKSPSSLVGAGEGVERHFPDRRIDHEIELAVIIGRGGYQIPAERVFDHVAGYCIGLDMSVRGTEDRSWRKSLNSFTVLGPALVTPDEIDDPDALSFRLEVNGEPRQASNTQHLVFNVARLIAYAAATYTLHPGDIILTGTPEGVGPVVPGDVMHCFIDQLGTMDVSVTEPAVHHAAVA